ncbi:hypothetical protein H9P43_004578 [Blastocladiella emersonii ATCC 22665]|nr:hypothetical protein H9P43_004578 [Blastocladiella emersonii ATCC 22665]
MVALPYPPWPAPPSAAEVPARRRRLGKRQLAIDIPGNGDAEPAAELQPAAGAVQDVPRPPTPTSSTSTATSRRPQPTPSSPVSSRPGSPTATTARPPIAATTVTKAVAATGTPVPPVPIDAMPTPTPALASRPEPTNPFAFRLDDAGVILALALAAAILGTVAAIAGYHHYRSTKRRAAAGSKPATPGFPLAPAHTWSGPRADSAPRSPIDDEDGDDGDDVSGIWERDVKRAVGGPPPPSLTSEKAVAAAAGTLAFRPPLPPPPSLAPAPAASRWHSATTKLRHLLRAAPPPPSPPGLTPTVPRGGGMATHKRAGTLPPPLRLAALHASSSTRARPDSLGSDTSIAAGGAGGDHRRDTIESVQWAPAPASPGARGYSIFSSVSSGLGMHAAPGPLTVRNASSWITDTTGSEPGSPTTETPGGMPPWAAGRASWRSSSASSGDGEVPQPGAAIGGSRLAWSVMVPHTDESELTDGEDDGDDDRAPPAYSPTEMSDGDSEIPVIDALVADHRSTSVVSDLEDGFVDIGASDAAGVLPSAAEAELASLDDDGSEFEQVNAPTPSPPPLSARGRWDLVPRSPSAPRRGDSDSDDDGDASVVAEPRRSIAQSTLDMYGGGVFQRQHQSK